MSSESSAESFIRTALREGTGIQQRDEPEKVRAASEEKYDQPVHWGAPGSREGGALATLSVEHPEPPSKMAARTCLTPDAVFSTHVNSGQVGVNVRLPGTLSVSEDEAKAMENEMHDALEAIIARRWTSVSVNPHIDALQKSANTGSSGTSGGSSSSGPSAAAKGGMPSLGMERVEGSAMGGPMGGSLGSIGGAPGAVMPGSSGLGNAGGDFGGTLANAATDGVGPGLASMIGKTPGPGTGTGFAPPSEVRVSTKSTLGTSTGPYNGFGKVSQMWDEVSEEMAKEAGMLGALGKGVLAAGKKMLPLAQKGVAQMGHAGMAAGKGVGAAGSKYMQGGGIAGRMAQGARNLQAKGFGQNSKVVNFGLNTAAKLDNPVTAKQMAGGALMTGAPVAYDLNSFRAR